VRGGVHAHAYALALEELTGVEMKKMLPIPKIENVALPESRPFEAKGLHRKLYRFSLDDYKDVAAVWRGQALDGSGPLEVVDGPPQGGDLAKLDGAGDAFIPEYQPEEIFEMAQKLYQRRDSREAAPRRTSRRERSSGPHRGRHLEEAAWAAVEALRIRAIGSTHARTHLGC
jgi:hypothetical protein